MKSMREVLVHEGATIRDAMEALDRSALQIVLVVDARGRLLGTVTDGDLRRALLEGSTLASPLRPYIYQDYASVSPSADRADVLDLMRARRIEQVPVVDDAGKVVGLHTLQALLGVEERPNWAVIMAGGKGTRLHPLTKDVPKPMLRVAGRPILERLVLHLVGYGIRRINLCVNHLSHVIEDYFGDGSRFGCRIDYVRETEAMGTGGALALLDEVPVDPVLVMNGDLVTQVNIADMFSFHADGGYAGTIGVRRRFQESPYGCVQADGGRLVRIKEKPIEEQLINAGIYVLNPALLVRVPKQCFAITALFEEALRDGLVLGAYEVSDDWIDVGQRDRLKEAREGE